MNFQQVPARPFADLLNERVTAIELTIEADVAKRHGKAVATVAAQFGWDGINGVRKLYRYRHQQRGTSRRRASGEALGRKGVFRSVDVHTDTYPRDTVEDALHYAGLDFTALYLDYAARLEGRRGSGRDVLVFISSYWDIADELVAPVEVAEEWCAHCQEVTLRDQRGDCHWCAGAREFKLKLAKQASYRRARERQDDERVAA